METIGVIDNVLEKRVGKTIYYLGTITSDKLRELTFVPVIEASSKTFLNEETEDGYQRPGSQSRMRRFKNFLKENPDSVVPAILISGRGHWRFVKGSTEGTGTLEISAPAAIVDGQHRAGGYILLYQGDRGEEGGDVRNVDFLLINETELEREIRQFVIVNNTQKGVPKSLTAFLDDEDEAQVAWALNTEEDSPFKDRISRINIARTHLFALHSVANEIKRMFDYGGLRDLDVPEMTDAVSRYWTTIADVWSDFWLDIEKLDDPEFRGRRDFEFKMLELTGYIAWSRVGKHILARSYSVATGFDWENVRRLVEEAGAVDWRKGGEFVGLTGQVGGAKMAEQMERLLPAEAGAEME